MKKMLLAITAMAVAATTALADLYVKYTVTVEGYDD